MKPLHANFPTQADAAIAVSPRAAVAPGTFLSGCRVLTREGMVAVGNLRAGDMVMTRDHGLQIVRKVEKGRLGWHALGRLPVLSPVEITAGALGQGLPARDVTLAPNHVVVVRLAGENGSTMVPAHRLVGCKGVRRAAYHDVERVSLTFDMAVQVNAEGLWCEASA